ncbi:uncharacterized protein GJ701_016870 [Geothlypis trichas]
MVDTGATYSVLNKRLGPLSDTMVQVVGATGKLEKQPFLQPLNLRFGGKQLDHQFLYMPNCPTPLLGRDLLSRLNVKIIFEEGRVKLEIPEEQIAGLFVIKEVDAFPIPEEIEQAVVPWVWESGVPGKSKAAQPVKVELKEGAQPVRVKQYPLKLEARRGVAPLIKQFLAQGILQECESEYNTPIFPVRKPNGKYRLVQDLRAINEIVKDIHPVVANPYTLLTSVSEEFKWFSVIDLKDAFFCIPLAVESRKYFAFEWEDPDFGRKKQLTWARLPQGYRHSPTIFGKQLAKELEVWKTTQVTISPSLYIILQYVDDIFLATKERETCVELTIKLLNMLGQAGYRVSKEKAQLLKNSVIYLGCEITQGQRRLGVNRIEAICAIPLPRNHQELRSFLGMVGWCRLWIMNFGLLAKPLYEALKQHQLEWTTQRKKAFQELKQALKEAPALGLPDLTKEFQLYVNERQKLALGVLTQKVGSWKRPVGYFSKQLDSVSSGWPSCLRAVAATIILIQEARKLTLGVKMTVFVPHMVMAVLEQKGGHWLSSNRMLQYQAILREQDDIEIRTTNHVNPAEFLRSDQEAGELVHDCVEVIEQVYASRPDLKDEPLEEPEWELYTDGSSFVENGTRYAGYAVVTLDQVIEAKALLPGTSAQKAEVIGLTRALYLSKDKRVNIWTDSKYAFGVVHVHGALWKERGLLNSQGAHIKHQEEVLQLLDAVHSPKAVAVIHVRGHQTAEGDIYRGNRFADVTARQVAREIWTQMALVPKYIAVEQTAHTGEPCSRHPAWGPGVRQEVDHGPATGIMERTPPGDDDNLHGGEGPGDGCLDPLHQGEEGTAPMGNPDGVSDSDDLPRKAAFLIILLLVIMRLVPVQGSTLVQAEETKITGMDVQLTCVILDSQKVEAGEVIAIWQRGAEGSRGKKGVGWDQNKQQGNTVLNPTKVTTNDTGEYWCWAAKDAWGRHDRMMLSLQRHGRRSRREVNNTIERSAEQENLVVGLIRDFGIMQNVTKITACLPLPQAAGEPIPWGIIPVTKMPESFKNVSWSCQLVPKPVEVWKDLCMTVRVMTKEECEKKPTYYGWIQNTGKCLIATPIDEPCNTVRIKTKSQRNEMSCQNVTQNFDTWKSWKTLWGPSVLEHYSYLGKVQWCIQWSGVKNQSHYRAITMSTSSREFRPQKEDWNCTEVFTCDTPEDRIGLVPVKMALKWGCECRGYDHTVTQESMNGPIDCRYTAVHSPGNLVWVLGHGQWTTHLPLDGSVTQITLGVPTLCPYWKQNKLTQKERLKKRESSLEEQWHEPGSGVKFGWILESLFPQVATYRNREMLDNLLGQTERLAAATKKGFKDLNLQLQAASRMTLQNRMALDLLLLKEHGVCGYLSRNIDHCCVHIPNVTLEVEKDISQLAEVETKTEEIKREAQHNWIGAVFDSLGLHLSGWITSAIQYVLMFLVFLVTTWIVYRCLLGVIERERKRSIRLLKAMTRGRQNEERSPPCYEDTTVNTVS